MSDINQEHYQRLAEWAESDDREIHPDRALRGRRAAEASRELLRRAGGRPSIDPDPDASGAAPRRQVRLPRNLNTRLDNLAAEQGRSASDIMRDAIEAYAKGSVSGVAAHEEELYAERLRRQAQAAAVAAGQSQWTDQLNDKVRVKLSLAWDDLTKHRAFSQYYEQLEAFIERKTLRSIGYTVGPRDMRPGSSKATNEQLLSLIEAEHEALTAPALAAQPIGQSPYYSGAGPWLGAPEEFRSEVNRILEAHIVAFQLHRNSRLVPVQSHEMHNAVVAPTLYLLLSQAQFAAAEKAYQKALVELRNRDAGDAITDAATALQEVLTAIGCTGHALGDQLKSARNTGVLKGNDTPLTEAIGKTVDWVSAKRGQGEAHRGDPDIDMSDAWMVVHVVGALIIRLSEP
jgi:predicted transcriptional regulator